MSNPLNNNEPLADESFENDPDFIEFVKEYNDPSGDTSWIDDLTEAPPWPTKDDETLVIFISKRGTSRPVDKPDDGQKPAVKTSTKKPSRRKKVN